jgi:hypothetical protein
MLRRWRDERKSMNLKSPEAAEAIHHRLCWLVRGVAREWCDDARNRNGAGQQNRFEFV